MSPDSQLSVSVGEEEVYRQRIERLREEYERMRKRNEQLEEKMLDFVDESEREKEEMQRKLDEATRILDSAKLREEKLLAERDFLVKQCEQRGVAVAYPTPGQHTPVMEEPQPEDPWPTRIENLRWEKRSAALGPIPGEFVV